MCRLFLWLDLTPDHPSQYLERQLMDFLKQSDHIRKHTPGIRNEHDYTSHTDGFGFAWQKNNRWSIYRNPLMYSRVPELPNVLHRISRHRLVLGHIRRATKPTATSHENTHPFYYRNHVFLHNGEIRGFPAKREVVLDEIDADLRASIKGQTDSEAVFYLFLSKLRSSPEQSLPTAFAKTVQFLEFHFELVILNIVISDKTHTLVSRYCSHVGRHRPPSLYWNVPIREAISKEGRFGFFPKLIVSSEPILESQTYAVPANTLMVIENQTGIVSLSRIT